MPQPSAAPRPITIGRESYEMSPLTDRDIDEVNNYLRSTFIQMARASLTPDMTKDEREELLGVAMERARRMSFLDPGGLSSIPSLEVVTRVIWQGLRERQPKLTWDEFKSTVLSLKDSAPVALSDDLDIAMRTWVEMNTDGGGKKSDPPTPAG